MMNGLLFSMPGHPDHLLRRRDRHGRQHLPRGPQRRPHPDAVGQRPQRRVLRRQPQRLYLPVIIDPEYHSQAVNVEAQQQNPNSLLWWMKRLIALRKRYRAFARGTLEVLRPDNRKVFAFIRRYGDERILVVVNLSRFVQCVELDLSEFRGAVPVELFGNRVPPVGDLPYFITLGPHGFYWFSLESEPEQGRSHAHHVVRSRRGVGRPLQRCRASDAFESFLPAYLAKRRWFVQKARTITKAVSLIDRIPCPPVPAGARSRTLGGADAHRPGRAGPREPRALRAAGRLRHRDEAKS
jgi:maltose alpha-D-glucosyltransferase/alpha-amylase